MDGAKSKTSAISTESTSHHRDAAIAAIADAQHGVISLAQLRATGLSASAARDRVAAGKLHRLYPGAYSVGHTRVSWRGRYMAAVLACGPGAVASHRPAARIHGLRTGAGRLDVTVPARRVRVRGIAVHQTRRLEREDVVEEDGIPCTAVARTIFDLADTEGDERRAQRDIDRAEQLRIFDLHALRRVIGERHGRRGARVLTSVLAQALEPAMTRNEIEERLFAICDAAGVPRPRVNFEIVLGDGLHVVADFAWPAVRVIVETDGWETHGTRRAFVGDRRRDRRLALAGWRVHRFTWHEIRRAPESVGAELRLLLAAAA